MLKSILLPQLIYNTLSNNEAVKSIVSKRIYPLAAENGTKYPFVVFTRDSITEMSRTKDGLVEDRVSFTITCVNDKYFDCLQLAQAVREAIEVRFILDEEAELILRDIELTNISETFSDNVYIEELSFTGNVSSYHKKEEKDKETIPEEVEGN